MFGGSRPAGRPARRVPLGGRSREEEEEEEENGSVGGRSSSSSSRRCGLSKAAFLEKVQQSNEACQRGDFQAAVRLYGEALRADPQNCILYSNRSAALLKLGRHHAALGDAQKARLLNPKWPKVRAEGDPTLVVIVVGMATVHNNNVAARQQQQRWKH